MTTVAKFVPVHPAVRPVVHVNRAMFAEQRQRLCTSLASLSGRASAAAVFKGASLIARGSSDSNIAPFRQDSYFQYLFGFEVEDCYGAVHLGNGKSFIFIPRLPESYAVWMGRLPVPEEVIRETGVDEVKYVDEMAAAFKSAGVTTLHVLRGVNTDSDLSPIRGDDFPGASDFTFDASSALFDAITEQRVTKTKLEQELFHEINKISSRAHVAVMKHCSPGLSQHHLESTFLHFCYYEGRCRHVSYQCICATGPDSAILHWVVNDRPILDGQMALLDMGGEYHCYASDITCCFPVNGKFTDTQKFVYETVLKSHDAVIAAMKPGVSWPDMHKLSLQVIADELRKADILRATDEEIWAHDLMYVFLPHGLGHLLGLDVHDVGGYTATTPPRPESLSFKKLRTARVLTPGMYITVEPGLYFNHILLEKAFADPAIKHFFNEAKLRQKDFWEFGGVRIESNTMITETGVVNYTDVPRLVPDIEAIMAGTKEWIVA